MHTNQSSLYKRQQIMQTEKPIQSWIVYREGPPDYFYLIIPYPGNSRHHISYYGSSPVTHLTPRLHITLKSSCHHYNKYYYSYRPLQCSWRTVGSVIETSTNMQINKDKEKRGTISMNISYLPSIVYITHNVFYTVKSKVYVGGVVHS
jgi:hypothetical protein